MDVNDSQYEKTELPIDVILFGVSMDVNDSQYKKAELPIDVTLFGISMDVNDSQYEYLQPVITQYFASNKSEIWS